MDISGRGGIKLDSHNLRDFLRIREEDRHNTSINNTASSSGGESRSNRSGLTLLAVLTEKRGPSPPADVPRPSVESARTLMDIIREDQIGGGRRAGGRSWQQLRDKIRLRHRGGDSAASSAVPFDRNNHRMVVMTRRSTRLNSNAHSGESSQSGRTGEILEQASQLPTRLSVTDDTRERSGEAVDSEAEQPVRTSLMALLSENDWQIGSEDSAYMVNEEDEEIAVAAASGDVGYNSCCVCMVRHKGAAFIPCGHTFCRLCSRELWVQRGNCPLCNNYILEILDIF